MSFEVKHIEKYIDHTYLKPDAGTKEIEKLCREARECGFFSVCVNGFWVPYCVEQLRGAESKVAAVVGFPLGAMSSKAKALEAELAAKQGAAEIDMVLPVGLLLEGRYDEVRSDIRDVVEAVLGQAIVKVILETGYLNADQKRTGCKLSEEAGAHFVKTSTGFGPGGATVEDIELMRSSVSQSVGVKASGGVRDHDTAVRMIVAGANRLGTSSGVAIVTGGGAAQAGSY
ncbi:deoxyribose-phosphate aldolase [Paenibacillus alkalitolerans]|uniref:deoxyribose-phosphate aldolase n=1 Tax=Paenibacillus alkalitolerans TaxID=2799335 RepID=UPI0018F52FAD|nr:deoxyribose-phosphate aldolase [Paenibacillus alkalitolerans]